MINKNKSKTMKCKRYQVLLYIQQHNYSNSLLSSFKCSKFIIQKIHEIPNQVFKGSTHEFIKLINQILKSQQRTIKSLKLYFSNYELGIQQTHTLHLFAKNLFRHQKLEDLSINMSNCFWGISLKVIVLPTLYTLENLKYLQLTIFPYFFQEFLRMLKKYIRLSSLKLEFAKIDIDINTWKNNNINQIIESICSNNFEKIGFCTYSNFTLDFKKYLSYAFDSLKKLKTIQFNAHLPSENKLRAFIKKSHYYIEPFVLDLENNQIYKLDLAELSSKNTTVESLNLTFSNDNIHIHDFTKLYYIDSLKQISHFHNLRILSLAFEGEIIQFFNIIERVLIEVFSYLSCLEELSLCYMFAHTYTRFINLSSNINLFEYVKCKEKVKKLVFEVKSMDRSFTGDISSYFKALGEFTQLETFKVFIDCTHYFFNKYSDAINIELPKMLNLEYLSFILDDKSENPSIFKTFSIMENFQKSKLSLSRLKNANIQLGNHVYTSSLSNLKKFKRNYQSLVNIQFDLCTSFVEC